MESTKSKYSFNIVKISYILLCLYLAIIPLQYTGLISTTWLQISLYGFIAVGILSCLSSKLTMNLYCIWLLIFTGLCLLSCIYSVNRANSFSVTIQILKIFMFAFVFFNVVKDRKQIDGIWVVLSISTLALILYLYTHDLLYVKGRLGNELTGNANTLASMLMFGAYGSVYCIYNFKNKIVKLLFVAFLLAQEYALALSGGRKYFILPVFLFLGMLLFSVEKEKRKSILIRILVVIAGLAGVYYLMMYVPEFYNAIGYRMEGLFVTIEGGYDSQTVGRVRLIKQAFNVWLKSPVFGVGINGFMYYSPSFMYSHCNYTEMLACLGIVGFAWYYSYYFRLIKKLRMISKKNNSIIFCGIALLCTFLYDIGAVSYTLVQNQLLLMLILATIEISNNASYLDERKDSKAYIV